MRALASLALLASLGAVASAQRDYIVSGRLSSSTPIFTRPFTMTQTSSSTMAYAVHPFVVDRTGTYIGEMTSRDTLEPYLLVYSDAFDPANPLANLLNGDEESSAIFTVLGFGNSSWDRWHNARIAPEGYGNLVHDAGLQLEAGRKYYAVATSRWMSVQSGGLGSYSLGIGGGPGFASVPEPATMAVLGLGAAALLRRRRRSA